MAHSDVDLFKVEAGPLELTELRRQNQELNIQEYERRETVLKSRPLALFIELTQNCNLRCPMCRYGEKYRPELNMPVEMYERVAEELFPSAYLVDLRGWGESTMLPYFGRIVADTLSYRVQLRLVTNGQINRPGVWDIMMRAHGIVAVSCDAADPDLFAILRAGGTVERLKKTVRTIVAARDRHGAPRESVHFNTCASRDNLHDLPRLVEMAAELGVARVVIHPLVSHLNDPSHLRHDLDGAADAYEKTVARGRTEGVVVQIGAAPDTPLAIPDLVRRPPCIHPWSYAYVSYDGGVGFCDHMIGSKRWALGSIIGHSFEEIWNGPGWTGIRQAHLTGDIPDQFAPCRYSYANRYIDFEHVVYPHLADRMLTSEQDRPVTYRRDPELVPSAVWIPEHAGGDAVRFEGGALVPQEFVTVRPGLDSGDPAQAR